MVIAQRLFTLSALLTVVSLLGVLKWNYDEKANLRHLSSVSKPHDEDDAEVKAATSGHVYSIAKKIRSVRPNELLYQDNPAIESQFAQSQWPNGEFWNRPGCKKWGAMTTIFPPTEAVLNFVTLDGWCLVVAGDRKGPEFYHVPPNAQGQVVFLSRERQEELEDHFEFVKKTPWNHFARKNVAYLFAIANGAEFIWDFDDDNNLFPNETLSQYIRASEIQTLAENQRTTVLTVDVQNNTECGVFNPYPFFQSSEVGVWPRGYPLDKINAPECQLRPTYCTREVLSDRIGIYQSLADKDPDVDAVYRLTRRLPVMFAGAPEDRPVLVPPHTMSPMNAQASLFSRIGLWSLFLPTTVHGRVSDIWRSYFAQTLAKNCGMHVAFVGPLVTQDRNAHTYLADMEAEKQLYERSGSLISFLLNTWTYNHSEPTLEGAWERLYADLYEIGIVEWDDVTLAQLWISAIKSVGYSMPPLVPATHSIQLEAVGGEASRVTSQCKQWMGWTTSRRPDSRPSTRTRRRTCGNDNVVLVGQFNFNTPVSRVMHWVRRWREVFQHVEVRGPLDESTRAILRRSGIKVFTAEADSGWYSPMKNLAESLRLHAKDATKCGVLTIHDDLLVNMTYMQELGFPSDDTIFTEYSAEAIAKPYFTFFPNGTFKVQNSERLVATKDYNGTLDNWTWWSLTLSNVSQAVASGLGRELFIKGNDGGMDFFHYGQSDFLYIPTSMAEQFAVHAEWMVANEIMLELALPTIIARLQNLFQATVKDALLCTEWDYSVRLMPSKWVSKCFGKGSYGTYHPMKLAKLGFDQWNLLFDRIVLGKLSSQEQTSG